MLTNYFKHYFKLNLLSRTSQNLATTWANNLGSFGLLNPLGQILGPLDTKPNWSWTIAAKPNQSWDKDAFTSWLKNNEVNQDLITDLPYNINILVEDLHSDIELDELDNEITNCQLVIDQTLVWKQESVGYKLQRDSSWDIEFETNEEDLEPETLVLSETSNTLELEDIELKDQDPWWFPSDFETVESTWASNKSLFHERMAHIKGNLGTPSLVSEGQNPNQTQSNWLASNTKENFANRLKTSQKIVWQYGLGKKGLLGRYLPPFTHGWKIRSKNILGSDLYAKLNKRIGLNVISTDKSIPTIFAGQQGMNHGNIKKWTLKERYSQINAQVFSSTASSGCIPATTSQKFDLLVLSKNYFIQTEKKSISGTSLYFKNLALIWGSRGDNLGVFQNKAFKARPLDEFSAWFSCSILPWTTSVQLGISVEDWTHTPNSFNPMRVKTLSTSKVEQHYETLHRIVAK